MKIPPQKIADIPSKGHFGPTNVLQEGAISPQTSTKLQKKKKFI